MPFLKNRELRIKVGKTSDNKTSTTETVEEILSPETILRLEEAGKRLMSYTAATVVAAIVLVKTADTLSRIAIKKTKSADQD